MVFHWSLSDSKSHKVSWTLLSILAILNNAVVWMVSTRPTISKSSSPLNNPLVPVPKAPIGIIVTFMFQFFFNSQAKSRYLSLFSHFFSLSCDQPGQQSWQFCKFSLNGWEKKLDGNYTKMLRAILNKSWRQHPTKPQLYGHLPPITKIIKVRQTRHAEHCWRSRDELISDVLLWTPTYGRTKVGRLARTYIQQLCEHTGCSPEDQP